MDATVNRQVTQSIAIEQRIFFTGMNIPDPLCDDNYHRTGPTDGLIHWGLRYPSAVNFDRFHPSRLFTIITTPVCHFQQPLISIQTTFYLQHFNISTSFNYTFGTSGTLAHINVFHRQPNVMIA